MQTESDLLFGWGERRAVAARASRVAIWLIPGLALAMLAANIALHFPGVMNNDSVSQYRQAVSGQYGDWHPPVMAWLWAQMRMFGNGPAPMLVLHLALYWLGFGLVADAMRRAGHVKVALAVTLAGAFPPFLYVNAQVVKDVGMAAAWLAAAGLLFWHRSQQRRIGVAAAVAIAVLLAYGTLVRTNAVFGLGALLVLAFAGGRWLRTSRLIAATVLAAVVALPAGKLLNEQLFRPKAEHAVQSLFLFDLMGVAVHTGDPKVIEPRATFTPQELRACYSPYWWDSLSMWGRCADRVNRPEPNMPTHPDGLASQWLRTIAAHPVAYLQHRLAHFNSALLFAVPSKHIRFTPEYRTGDPALKPLEVVTERDVKLDIVRKNPLVWPATWLAWAVCLLVLLRRHTDDRGVLFARVLAVSALGYSGAYLLIGVATDMRYHYWSMLAVLLATLAATPRLAQLLRRRDGALFASIGVVCAVIAIGVATRLLDFRGFVA
jgi:hypothetical protein